MAEENGAQAYFLRMDDGCFMPTAHVGGAWNVSEQHVAPAIGLLVGLPALVAFMLVGDVMAHRDGGYADE